MMLPAAFNPRPRCVVLILCSWLVGALFTISAAGSVQHFVLVKFKAETGDQERYDVLRQSAQMARLIPGLLYSQSGRNNSTENLDQGFTHALSFQFESSEALAAYATHPEHVKFLDRVRPTLAEVLVYDLELTDRVPPAQPGQTHHLVFVNYKEGASEEDKQAQREAFLSLEERIPGVLSIHSGPDAATGKRSPSFQDLFWVTFTSSQARDDYLPHPAHQKFVKGFVPHVEKVMVVDFTVSVEGDPLTVTGGVVPYQVVPRDESGKADFEVSGICGENGTIQARLLEGGRTLPGLDWQEAGRAEAGRFSAVVRGVPAGGEYSLELRRLEESGVVAEVAAVDHLLVGDLWLLSGQSNMYGLGNLVDVEPPDRRVHLFGMDESWRLAVEPLHSLIESPDPVHSDHGLKEAKSEVDRENLRAAARRKRRRGAGLGLPFARQIVTSTGIPVGLIASAHGGTQIGQWDPSGRDRGGETLYGSMYKQVGRAGGPIKGVLWYQGESDALGKREGEYLAAFTALVGAMRRDFGDPDLPVLTVQLARLISDQEEDGWNGVREAQRLAEEQIPGVSLISTLDLEMDDWVHVGTQGLKTAGRRLARLALSSVYRQEEILPGPRPVRAVADKGGYRVRLSFSGVNGGLLPLSNIRGFSFTDGQGEDVEIVFDAFPDPEDPTTVLIQLSRDLPRRFRLWYGKGLNPAANLTDSEGMAAPSFGPMPVER